MRSEKESKSLYWIDGGDFMGAGDKETLAQCELVRVLKDGPSETQEWEFKSETLTLVAIVRTVLGEFVRIDWYGPKCVLKEEISNGKETATVGGDESEDGNGMA